MKNILSGLKRPVIIAHRGYKAKYPENTLASFEAAVACGAPMIELDITLTRDRKIVVIHDDTLNRTTSGRGAVMDFTLTELKQLDAGAWFSPAFQGQTIPTLEELFHWIHPPVLLNIEIKTSAFEPHHPPDAIENQLVDMIRANHRMQQVLVSSFEPGFLINIARQHPDISLALLSKKKADNAVVSFCKKYNIVSWNPNHRILTPDQVRRMHQHNIAVFPYTVNRLKDAKKLINMGVDGFFTDDPVRMMDQGDSVKHLSTL